MLCGLDLVIAADLFAGRGVGRFNRSIVSSLALLGIAGMFCFQKINFQQVHLVQTLHCSSKGLSFKISLFLFCPNLREISGNFLMLTIIFKKVNSFSSLLLLNLKILFPSIRPDKLALLISSRTN